MVDRSDQVISRIDELGIDCLIAVGGDGSLRIAAELANKGLKVVGVPKTIDNDLDATTVTFGFHTAVQTATDAIGKLHSTAEAHQRVMVVELMGHADGCALRGVRVHAINPHTGDPSDLAKVAAKIEDGGRGLRVRDYRLPEGALPKGVRHVSWRSVAERRKGWGLASGSHGASTKLTGHEPAAWCSGTFSAEGSPIAYARILLSVRHAASSWVEGDISLAWWR